MALKTPAMKGIRAKLAQLDVVGREGHGAGFVLEDVVDLRPKCHDIRIEITVTRTRG
jgi:hypothetical protein